MLGSPHDQAANDIDDQNQNAGNRVTPNKF